ncbi:hypothetical protein STURON_00751 [Spiroplasma turonicum]|uniref:Transmembrane protein n=2 Tax=Spiroplasma turonicum TaxID=216946 RepID=A0A0K1P7Z8_9MOLU|nr:hypothetical protein STURON_00751 [Spiroplasma turonicum]ALX70999.1 hypothetical protein STURO_v1c07480 [Spiroplasma turonicum]
MEDSIIDDLIDSEFKEDKEFENLLKVINRLIIFRILILIIGVLLLLGGLLKYTLFDLKTNQKNNLTINMIISFLIIGIGFILIVIYGLSRFYNFGFFNSFKKIANLQFKNDRMTRLYNGILFNSSYSNLINDIKFIYNNSTISFYSNERKFNNTSFDDKKNSVNNIIFNFKNKNSLFFINDPYKTVRSNGKTTRVDYTIIYELYYKNDKFDESYNNIVVSKGTKFDKNYQTESELFNRKYDINLKSNDIRAAMFLTPKLIDKLMSIENDDNFHKLSIYNNFHVVHKKKSTRINDYPLGVIEYKSINSYKEFKKRLSKKLKRDLNLIINSLVYVESIY